MESLINLTFKNNELEKRSRFPDSAILPSGQKAIVLRVDSKERTASSNSLNLTEKEGFRRDRVPFYTRPSFFGKNRTKLLKGFGVSGHISNLISGSDGQRVCRRM